MKFSTQAPNAVGFWWWTHRINGTPTIIVVTKEKIDGTLIDAFVCHPPGSHAKVLLQPGDFFAGPIPVPESPL